LIMMVKETSKNSSAFAKTFLRIFEIAYL
jgi:hypothetical protein